MPFISRHLPKLIVLVGLGNWQSPCHFHIRICGNLAHSAHSVRPVPHHTRGVGVEIFIHEVAIVSVVGAVVVGDMAEGCRLLPIAHVARGSGWTVDHRIQRRNGPGSRTRRGRCQQRLLLKVLLNPCGLVDNSHERCSAGAKCFSWICSTHHPEVCALGGDTGERSSW